MLRLIFLLICLMPSLTFSASLIGSGIVTSTPIGDEIGYLTIGATASVSRGRRIEATTPAGGLDASHGYLYTTNATASDIDVVLGIYTAAGVQVGACSNTVTIPASTTTPQYYEVTWTSAVTLSGSTVYHVQYHTTDGNDVGYYYDTTALSAGYSNNATDRCGDYYATSSTRIVTMSISDYDVR